MTTTWKSWKFITLATIFQIAFIIIFAVLVEYSKDAIPLKGHNVTFSNETNSFSTYYPMFQHVNIMVFVGFGFLMTFLKKYGFSGVGLNFLLATFCIQLALIMQNVWHMDNGKIRIGILQVVKADIAAAVVLISFGAVLGKTNPLQLIVMAVIEITVFACNEHLGNDIFKIADVGGSILVHLFGAYFGLGVSFALNRREFLGNIKQTTVYHSDLFAMIGTIFLWVFWPGFNAVLADEKDQHRVFINTVMSLCGSCVATFITSSFLGHKGRLEMDHIQNATLSGGVAIGTAANMMIHPFGAMIVGSIVGCICTLGYHSLTPCMSSRIHDTCGVHNLHGIPGVIGGVVGAVVSSVATKDIYEASLYTVFPGMVPKKNSTEYKELLLENEDIEPGFGYTASQQAIAQAMGLVCSFLIASASGYLTGLIIRNRIFDPPNKDQLYDDNDYWSVPTLAEVS